MTAAPRATRRRKPAPQQSDQQVVSDDAQQDVQRPVKRPAHRPSCYTDEIAGSICAQLAAGQSLHAICKQDGMPAESTVRRWMVDDVSGFYANYMRAREGQADALADRVVEIVDGTVKGDIDPQAARAAIDGIKWFAGKVRPKVYGERADGMSVNVTVNQPGYVIDLRPPSDGPAVLEHDANPATLALTDG